MRIFLFLTAPLVVTLAAEEKYSNKYDSVNIDRILSNDRLFINYFKCIMDKGSCTPDAAEMRNHLPEILSTGCQKCTEFQTEATEKIISFLMEKKPGLWKQVEEKYDHEGIQSKKFLEARKKHPH